MKAQSRAGKWFSIENFEPGVEPTVIWNADRRADRTSVRRLASKEGFPRLPELVAAFLESPLASFEERESHPLAYVPVPGGRRAVFWHIPEAGPVQEVPWGLLVWLGPAAAEPSPRPRAAGVRWDPLTGNLHNSRETFLLSASNLDHYADITDPDSFFARTVHFPGLTRLLDGIFRTDTDPNISTSCTLLHDDGSLINNYFVGKRIEVDGRLDARAITMDITSFEPPTLDPDTAARIVRSTPEGQSRAIVALRDAEPAPVPIISYWCRPGAPTWMPHWDYYGPVPRNEDAIIHPDDHQRLADVAQALDCADHADLELRCVDTELGWRTVDASISRYPDSPQLYILQLPNWPASE